MYDGYVGREQLVSYFYSAPSSPDWCYYWHLSVASYAC